ncbi:MAG: flagellar hook-basal body complex protein FliE [Candidatus Marinimicrobia bacterium]|nr:flagellar hook-basal body complex protein FliE [Candidatus Neomarinimicrobiota bacterium]
MTQIYDLIQSIQGTQPARKGADPLQNGEAPGVAQKSFGDTMTDFLEVVNGNSKAAAAQVTDVVQGNSDSLTQAMISMEESKLSFQLMIEIRSKLLDSYQEISRMQV